MNLFQKPRPQNLDEWLEIATQKLAQPAKNRIRSDIESHYDEAVAGHLENGLPSSTAQTAALMELGGAKAASGCFRREHLTESEFKMVAKLLKSGRIGWIPHCANLSGSCGISLAIAHLLHARPNSELEFIIEFLLFALFETVIFVLTRRNTPRRLVLIMAWSQFIYGIGLWALFLNSSHGWFFRAMAGLSWFPKFLSYFRLRNKLGKVTEDWMIETGESRKAVPPGNPIAS